jgi:hypothetical protein
MSRPLTDPGSPGAETTRTAVPEPSYGSSTGRATMGVGR